MLLRMALFFLNYPVRISQKSCRATLLGVLYITPLRVKKPHLGGILLLAALGLAEFVSLVCVLTR